MTLELNEHELIAQRREKLRALRESQSVAYPNDFEPSTWAHDLHEQYGALDADQLSTTQNRTYRLAGRILLQRVMGKASFIQLQDMTGSFQIYVRQQDLPEGVYDQFKHWDLGDIVGVEGYVFRTKTGELSLHAQSIRLLVKSLRPLPDKFHGLHDQETRYRQRYVDLMVNPSTRSVFHTRIQIIEHIRQFLKKRRFLEVETPMMHPIPGGATARPFMTHHNALDKDLYLRIAPELYLKRLVVGGLDRVFEINRNFRNEGLSTQHNPEFTMLEFYQAYATYEHLMDLTEELLQELVQSIHDSTTLTYQGKEYSFEAPFKRLSMKESIVHFNSDIALHELDERSSAERIAQRLGIDVLPSDGLGRIHLAIFEKTVEHRLEQPTFITEYPAEVSPLARRNDRNPFVTDRFEFFVAGREIANGFSELNDSEDQAERFKAQVEAKEAGDVEAMHFDSDYITALEYGLPPTAGEGIGIDRLTMLLTDSGTIRDVVLFPILR